MVGTKNNRRVKMTQDQLKAALVRLLGQMPLDQITVTAICQEADVNRGTFYAHYRDQNDLFHAVETDLVTQVSGLIGPITGEITPWLTKILTIIRDQDAATRIIISNIRDSPVLQVILAPIRKETEATYRRLYHEDDPAMLAYYFDFVFSGAVRVIINWLTAGAKESPAQIAGLIANVTPR